MAGGVGGRACPWLLMFTQDARPLLTIMEGPILYLSFAVFYPVHAYFLS